MLSSLQSSSVKKDSCLYKAVFPLETLLQPFTTCTVCIFVLFFNWPHSRCFPCIILPANSWLHRPFCLLWGSWK